MTLPTDSEAALLQQIRDELQQVNRWLRVLAEPALVEQLRGQIRTKTDRDIYQASTGGSTREVGASAGVSNSTVAAAWDRWARTGIVRPTGTPGRYERIVDLATLRIEV